MWNRFDFCRNCVHTCYYRASLTVGLMNKIACKLIYVIYLPLLIYYIASHLLISFVSITNVRLFLSTNQPTTSSLLVCYLLTWNNINSNNYLLLCQSKVDFLFREATVFIYQYSTYLSEDPSCLLTYNKQSNLNLYIKSN